MDTFTLRKILIQNIENLNPVLLSQVYNFTEQLKSFFPGKEFVEDNIQTHPLYKFVGIISNSEAKEMKKIIDDEFSQLEGEW